MDKKQWAIGEKGNVLYWNFLVRIWHSRESKGEWKFENLMLDNKKIVGKEKKGRRAAHNTPTVQQTDKLIEWESNVTRCKSLNIGGEFRQQMIYIIMKYEISLFILDKV